MSSATEYLGVAGLLMLSRRNIEYPEDRAELATMFEATYQWKCDESTTDRLVRQLGAWGAVNINVDKYAGETFRIFDDNLREARALIANSQLGVILRSGEYGGAPWFKKVFDNNEFWMELYEERNADIQANPEPIEFEIKSIDAAVPAADRIVSRRDNYETIGEIDRSLEEIATALSSDNEVGAEVGDERDVLSLEVEVARTVITKPNFRLSSLMGWLMPALRFLAEKFASGAIGEAAKHLMILLEKLF